MSVFARAAYQGNGWIMERAEGWPLHAMWNRGIDVSLRDHPVVFLNNDLILDDEPNWITRLCAPLDEGWAAVCPNYDNRQHYATVQRVRGVAAGRNDGTGGLAGFAFAVHPRILKDYRFPTELKWWFGDTDLVMTLDQRDEPYGVVRDVGVTHIGGGSQTAKDFDLDEVVRKDRETFEAKWGAIA
jgi:hypothetical protein